MTSAELLHWPDRRIRIEKQQWRQACDLLEQAVSRAEALASRGRPRVALATPIDGLAAVLSARLALRLDAIDHAAASGVATKADSQHLTAVTHPEILPLPQRMELFRRCIRAVRPAGQLVLLANVVGPPQRRADGTSVTVPNCSGLLEQLEAASGQGLMIDELRSVRWGDEPVHRGVVLRFTRLSTPIGW